MWTACLIPDFRGKIFNLLPLSMMLTGDLSHIAFIMLRYVPSMHNLLGFFLKS